MNTFNKEQLDKLSDFFMDVAKGLTLAALAVPTIDSSTTLFSSLKIFFLGILFAYTSLRILSLKEVIR